jgi:biopolymer transport protein ExbD
MFSARFRHREDPNVEIDMVPIMNMFLVLIPFLLISSSFLHLKAINTSVPVKSNSSAEVAPDQSEVSLTLMVSLTQSTIDVKPTAAELTDSELSALDFAIKRQDDSNDAFAEFTERLALLKQQYPKSDTLILSPENSVPYKDMVKLMDAARGLAMEEPLFAKVVISGVLK